MFKQLELYGLKVIKKEKKSYFSSILRFFLFLVSCLFQLGVLIRNALYDHGVFRCYHPPIPLVISVGNLVAGGTGKTPFTKLLIQEFYPEKMVAILSRGYRSKAEHAPLPVILSHGEGPLYPASYCGDEPFLIAKEFPKAMVIVGKDKKKGADIAAKASAQILILDDGFQYRKLARDIDVVCLDCNDPFGLGYYLPRGLLREGKEALKRAHLIVLNHTLNEETYRSMKELIQPLTKGEIVAVDTETTGVFDLQDSEILSIEGRNVACFCGIANPEYFFQSVEEKGGQVILKKILQDHAEMAPNDLQAFALAAKKKGAHWVLCTEKDKVKLPLNLELPLPLAWLKVRLKWIGGKDSFKAFIHRQLLVI